MTRYPIFPFSFWREFSLAATLLLAMQFAPVQAAEAVPDAPPVQVQDLTDEDTEVDPDADLKAQKLPHQENITMIEYERRAWQRDLSKREERCLKRFFSFGCIDDLRKEYLKEMRSYDLRKEEELQIIRNIDSEIRQRVRARKAVEAERRATMEKPLKTEKPVKTDTKDRP